MTEFPEPSAPVAVTRRSHRISIIWLVPIVALGIAAWLAWDTLSKEGPTIQVTFEGAEGLQAGQSQLKYRDIVFGTVKGLDLAADREHVVVTIATTREATPLLTEKTIFWVVKPRLFAGNISGLETVLSGSYVGMVPGDASDKKRHEFVGREDPPILQAHTPGRIFELRTPRIGSISVGSPIFFRDLGVGEVLGWEVDHMAESVTIRAFIRAPYDDYVKDETRFWNASGVSIKLGAGGIDIQVESLRALLLGGVAFETPAAKAGDAEAAENHLFPLFVNREEANAASYTRILSAVSYFDGSVRGLAPGSDVSMHGLKIGRVNDVRLTFDPGKGTILAAVRYEVQPERIVGVGQRGYKTDEEAVGTLLSRGLRASIETASLITGEQVVATEFVPDAPPTQVLKDGNSFLIPTTESGGFADLAATATDVLNKVGKIPFAQIGASLANILKSADEATDGPQLKKAVSDLAATLATAHDLMQKVDSAASPALKRLPEIAATLQQALTNVNNLTVSIDGGYGNSTKFHRDLDRLLLQTDDALRSIRGLADLMLQHPEALIKGRPE